MLYSRQCKPSFIFLFFSLRTSGQANEGHPPSAKSTKRSRPLGKWSTCRYPFTLPDLGTSGDSSSEIIGDQCHVTGLNIWVKNIWIEYAEV